MQFNGPKNMGVALTLALLATLVLGEEMWTEDAESLVQVAATTSASPGGSGVVDNIASLKAYCLVAGPMLQDMDAFKGNLKNGAMRFVAAFGKRTGKEVVTEFAEVIGDLEALHPNAPGVEGYMLDELNGNILKGESALTLKDAKFIMDATAFGLMHTPEYFKKLAVPVYAFTNAKDSISEGATGKALSTMQHSQYDNVYEGIFDGLQAKYNAQQLQENEYATMGAKIAVVASFKKGETDEDGNQQVMAPLPIAGATGASSIRKERKFKMPTHKEIQKEALAKAKKYMASEARENGGMTVPEVVQKVERILKGTTVRVTTRHRMFADSTQSPFIKIHGTKGTIKGRLNFLPLSGKTLVHHFALDHSIGAVDAVVLTGDKKHDNPWLIDKFEVQVGHGNPWLSLRPDGKTSFVDGFWLDGKTSNKGPYFRLAHEKKWMLLPTDQKLAYVVKYKKAPTCASLGCIEGDRAEMETACNKHHKCQGFTFPSGASAKTKAQGCLKYRCNSATQDTDTDTTAAFVANSKDDYWSKQAFVYKTWKYKQSDCPKKCSYHGHTFKGKRWCQQIVDGKKVRDELCEDWEPKLFVPKIPSTVCPPTPSCYKWATTPANNCITSCGTAADTKYGTVICRRKTDNGQVGLASCNDIQALDRLSKPSKPVTHCPATARCVHWTSRFTSGCPGGCGHGASNIYTSSYCVATNGAAGSDSECAHWGLPRPAAQSQYCAGTAACHISGCCYLVNYNDSPTSCARCRGGNEYAFRCSGTGSNGGTRQCR